jgi:hypothetical protein
MIGKVTVTDASAEDLKNRTCATCACMYPIEPPRIQAYVRAPAGAPVPTLYICRLNPPQLLNTPEGPRLQQQQVFLHMSCWHWKAAGTLPGDIHPLAECAPRVRM